MEFLFSEHTALGIASVIALNLMVQIVKRYIKPKWGEVGIHVFTFTVSLVVIVAVQIVNAHPELMQAISYAGQLLVAAVALYEVIWKRIGDMIQSL